MTKKPAKATIVDVARTAGVSLSTVSRVMNGNASVDPELADRVRASAEALGYAANPLARSLVLGRTQTVAVVVPDLANPTFQAILRGISRAAADDGYHVLVADTAEQVSRERPIAVDTRRRTDGVVLCAPRMDADTLATLLPDLAPVVVVNRSPQPGTPVVSADYGTSLGELVTHLYALGHRTLAFLAGATGSASGAARRGALAAARTAHPDLVIVELPCGVDFDSGASVAGDVIDSGATGVLAFNDLVAMGLLSALADRGVRVPQDVSVAGFDDIPFARYTSPPLTTAAVPAERLGADAWAALHAQLRGEAPIAAVTHHPQIAVRGSTGPAPR